MSIELRQDDLDTSVEWDRVRITGYSYSEGLYCERLDGIIGAVVLEEGEIYIKIWPVNDSEKVWFRRRDISFCFRPFCDDNFRGKKFCKCILDQNHEGPHEDMYGSTWISYEPLWFFTEEKHCDTLSSVLRIMTLFWALFDIEINFEVG